MQTVTTEVIVYDLSKAQMCLRGTITMQCGLSAGK